MPTVGGVLLRLVRPHVLYLVTVLAATGLEYVQEFPSVPHYDARSVAIICIDWFLSQGYGVRFLSQVRASSLFSLV